MENEETVFPVKGSRFNLKRLSDGVGDSGSLLVPIDCNTQRVSGKEGTIEIGKGVRCGSPFAGTYTEQDYWTTTPVVRILERAEDLSWVKFQTRNSVYLVSGY